MCKNVHLICTSCGRFSRYSYRMRSATDTIDIDTHIASLINQKFYPCVAAVQSLAKHDYAVISCEGFGTGRDREKIRSAVFAFIDRWKTTRSTTLTLWIAYPHDQVHDENEFETSMWNELSALTSKEEAATEWAAGWSQDPADRKFTLCIGGHAFFVVGLHPGSSRAGRRFQFPALIFNAFDQFQELQAQGLYDAMVKKNRERDLKFSGSVNPMAAAHGDDWETIQFSGRDNSREWKCPFHLRSREQHQYKTK